MKTEQVQFKRKPTMFGGHGTWVGRGHIRLCGTTTNRAISIPKGTDIMYAVFSDKRSVNDFTITKRPSWNGGVAYGVDVNFMLMLSARMLLERMYKKGYRHVRIEY